MYSIQHRNIELPSDILIKPYTVHILGGLLLLSTLHKGRLPALNTFISGFYFLFVLHSKTDMLKAELWIQVGVRIWEGQNAPPQQKFKKTCFILSLES
jgi:hypothetical protein